MQKTKNFFTGSCYNGAYSESTQCMQGFGIYHFKDGSEYRGYFHLGRFQGFGCIKFPPPHQIILKGFFDNGKLVTLDKMHFTDGLHLNVNSDGETMNFDNWNYCCEKDRRYRRELQHGLEPIGPNFCYTNSRLPKVLPEKFYDIGGRLIYTETSGFIYRKTKPLRFVGCQKEVEWIKNNCRKSEKAADWTIDEQNFDLYRNIINTNISELLNLRKDDQGCGCNLKKQPEPFSETSAEEATSLLENPLVDHNIRDSIESQNIRNKFEGTPVGSRRGTFVKPRRI